MKLFFSLLALLFHLSIYAQNDNPRHPLKASFYGPYFTQPGIKIGTELQIIENNQSENGQRIHEVFIGPQIGMFVRPGNHTSYVLNADVGYRFQKEDSNNYKAASVGFAYLLSNQILSKSVDLSNGEIVGTNKELRHYFLPTINIEIGRMPDTKQGWFGKLSYGRKISKKIEDSGFFALELGLILKLRKKES